MRSVLRIPVAVALGVFAVWAVSCKRSSTETAGSTPSGDAAQPAAAAAVEVKWDPNVTLESVEPVDLEVGRSVKPDNHVAEPALVFKPADTIHFVLDSRGSVSGVKIQLVVTFQTGAPVFESNRVVNLSGPTATDLHASNPGGWPVGKYQGRVLINGRSYRTWDFEVK
ncbi:MAG: hypothetical protein ACRD1P_09030 [Thermoanaerobaculia bacterium]